VFTQLGRTETVMTHIICWYCYTSQKHLHYLSKLCGIQFTNMLKDSNIYCTNIYWNI